MLHSFVSVSVGVAKGPFAHVASADYTPDVEDLISDHPAGPLSVAAVACFAIIANASSQALPLGIAADPELDAVSIPLQLYYQERGPALSVWLPETRSDIVKCAGLAVLTPDSVLRVFRRRSITSSGAPTCQELRVLASLIQSSGVEDCLALDVLHVPKAKALFVFGSRNSAAIVSLRASRLEVVTPAIEYKAVELRVVARLLLLYRHPYEFHRFLPTLYKSIKDGLLKLQKDAGGSDELEVLESVSFRAEMRRIITSVVQVTKTIWNALRIGFVILEALVMLLSMSICGVLDRDLPASFKFPESHLRGTMLRSGEFTHKNICSERLTSLLSKYLRKDRGQFPNMSWMHWSSTGYFGERINSLFKQVHCVSVPENIGSKASSFSVCSIAKRALEAVKNEDEQCTPDQGGKLGVMIARLFMISVQDEFSPNPDALMHRADLVRHILENSPADSDSLAKRVVEALRVGEVYETMGDLTGVDLGDYVWRRCVELQSALWIPLA
ncbi:hypothetical protein FGB62_117g18 [Gracilaria domingensis]|nr:hypothetical protein FGB62_117g18 [Gracilaria domingensis]